jgi:hypothetical protein
MAAYEECNQGKYKGLTREEARLALKANPHLWAEERRAAAKFIPGIDKVVCRLCDKGAITYKCCVDSTETCHLITDVSNKKRKLKKLLGACAECCNDFECIRRVIEHVFGDPHLTFQTDTTTFRVVFSDPELSETTLATVATVEPKEVGYDNDDGFGHDNDDTR